MSFLSAVAGFVFEQIQGAISFSCRTNNVKANVKTTKFKFRDRTEVQETIKLLTQYAIVPVQEQINKLHSEGNQNCYCFNILLNDETSIRHGRQPATSINYWSFDLYDSNKRDTSGMPYLIRGETVMESDESTPDGYYMSIEGIQGKVVDIINSLLEYHKFGIPTKATQRDQRDDESSRSSMFSGE